MAAAMVSLRNQVLVVAAHAGLAWDVPPGTGVRVEAVLPAAAEAVRHLAACAAAREILFYYAHRLLRTRPLYRRYHKGHHRFTCPTAFSAQYAHPVEHLVANVLPIALPPLVLRSHVVVWWAFRAWQLLETATVHSGYDFLAGAARRHDSHHEKFNVFYGGIGLLDWLHGTDGRQESRAAIRDE